MEWDTLLNPIRQSAAAADAPSGNTAERSAFNKDYGRVLYSSAFRRLQDKTQVFPLGRNDYVRTRMTHSLEVVNVGRSLAKRLHSIAAHRGAAVPDADDMEDIVATVCLAHDIGNPPFGHSGEDAISSALQGTAYEGFCFEGNAQGFRLLSKICDPIKGQGLNLTAATLAAFTKYPCTAASKRHHYKKFGIMPEEQAIFAEVAQRCGLPALDEQGDVWARHPLALLMEAADDISYLIADIEDAYFSKIISYEECIHQLAAITPSIDKDRMTTAASAHEQAGCVHTARALAVSESIDRIENVLQREYDSIMSGTFTGSLMKHVPGAYDSVKQFSAERIYNHESVIRIEITGFNVLKDLIQLFMEWVTAPASPLGRKIGDILHAPDTAEEHERFLHIIDYVSGMTDSYALHTYNTLFGHTAF